MSDTTTNVDDVQGPVLSGIFNAAVSIEAGEKLPAELQNATLRQMLLGVIAAMQQIEDRLYHQNNRDTAERKIRQSEADDHRAWVRQQLTRQWLVMSVLMTILAAEIVVLVVLVAERL